MPDPINYTGMQVQVDPAQALLSGLKTGVGIQQVQQAQLDQERQQQAQLQQQADLRALVSNPSPSAQDYATYTLKYPSQAAAVKQAFSLLDEQQQQQKISDATRVYGALQANRPDLAASLMDARIAALKNGGSPADYQSSQVLKELIDTDPTQATRVAGLYLASVMGPDKFSAAFPAIGKESREQAAASGEQAKTAAETRNLESQVATRAAQLGIDRENNRIKAMEAGLARETNQLKRQELQGKIDDAKQKRDQLQRENVSTAESAFSTVDRALDTIKELQKHPGLAGNLGKTGVLPNIPGSDSANARALIDQLQSQGFLAEVDKMRGLGALTEAEGKKLTNAIGALDTKQSEDQFRKQLADINRQFTDARARIGKRYGVAAPDRAEPPLFQSAKYGAVTQAMIDKLAKDKGVSADVAERFYREAR